jgi:large subunit ribosomal protein L15e
MRGGRQRPYIVGGRRPKTSRQRLVLNMSYQMVAEMRAQKKYPNCEVLNSYNVGKDGKYYWYDIIMVDRAHPAITSDKDLAWIANHRGRVFRGKTSAGRKSKMG